MVPPSIPYWIYLYFFPNGAAGAGGRIRTCKAEAKGLRIRDARQRANMTQQMLADHCGVIADIDCPVFGSSMGRTAEYLDGVRLLLLLQAVAEPPHIIEGDDVVRLAE